MIIVSIRQSIGGHPSLLHDLEVSSVAALKRALRGLKKMAKLSSAVDGAPFFRAEGSAGFNLYCGSHQKD